MSTHAAGNPAPAKGSSVHAWLRLPRVKRGLAAGLVVLSTGGLVLARTPTGSGPVATPETHVVLAGGSNAAAFAGPGVRGRFALSHTAILRGGERRVFAELDLSAEASQRHVERAPLSMAIALDTSGSMEGEKIQEAKRACVRMIREMRDDDQIAFLRYASDVEVVQPLARVGSVREGLISRIQRLEAAGGTNIPPALSLAAAQLAEASKGCVRRVVLASDGLDSTRAVAERYAKQSADMGVTVSSMGIGLDFDEGYMGGVAKAGRGNFGFVKDASSLATFLHRELEETATTTVENVVARIRLPEGVRLVQANGCEARQRDGGELELAVGSLFAGDERRIIVELAATVGAGETRGFDGTVAWAAVGGDTATARFAGVALTGTDDALAVEAGRDGAVLANATSVIASAREIQAAEAFSRGDKAGAEALIDQNMLDLKAAATAAPAAAPRLMAQHRAYERDRGAFAAAPSSDEGRAAAKAAAEKNIANGSREVGF
jgi:Ca-activated chloride channel family protein